MRSNSIDGFLLVKSTFLKNKAVIFVKQLFCILVLALLFSACSGDDNGSDKAASGYYFRASLDGRKIDFYTVNFQGGGNDNRFEQIVIGGYETPFPKIGELAPPSLDFEIWKLGGDIKPGTYSTPADEGMAARYAVQTANGTILYSTRTADDIFTVKIESISKSGIKGTFSGKVRNGDSGTAIEITEGTFNLPYLDIVNP
ncbi:hypothetical protein L1276_000403 [Flavobacterium sp. HSC-32F16]|uniref:hypothetical protein n=1 Tax=Flavobacterium sp. HSC-32F16 TaxID=2910964 RepID=UPI0020A31466|nr:hypothetical protein [Flavobacterium sp. HSC-32F16]MCP2025263.1 hypothetical protein [Flavobacterium sp. HSC-32F16]